MSSVAQRSPSWAPWESHPDPKKSVGSVLCPGGVAATTSAGVAVALTKALLTRDNGSARMPENVVTPAALTTPGGLDETCKEVTP